MEFGKYKLLLFTQYKKYSSFYLPPIVIQRGGKNVGCSARCHQFFSVGSDKIYVEGNFRKKRKNSNVKASISMNRGVESKIIRALSEEVHKDTAWGFQVKNNAQLKSEWDARSQQDSYVREAQQDKDEARRSELRDKVSLYSGKALGTHGTLAPVPTTADD
jgi:hypothetical protein